MWCSSKALSDKRRRKILSTLGRQNTNAGEIASKSKISQPTVSKHLKILKEAGVIKYIKAKQNRIYSLNKAKLQKAIETLLEIST